VTKDGLTPLGFITKLKDGFFGPSPKKNARTLILLGADPSRAFDSIDDLKEFFDGDVSRVPEEAMEKVRKRNRARGAFGRF
jgi:hypothetical protein